MDIGPGLGYFWKPLFSTQQGICYSMSFLNSDGKLDRLVKVVPARVLHCEVIFRVIRSSGITRSVLLLMYR